ncbi:MAG: branched-chain amino acid ABC transporter permease [Rhodospirillales bacterium]|nr:branched-chain amino acid ABC transporter permease [Rhodospirillales bacterium]
MTAAYLSAQLLNGLQLGVMLFLLAAGMTLIFGIMGLINLAHGSFYMVGAYVAATVAARSGSFLIGLGAGIAVAVVLGILVEVTVIRPLYRRDHLQHVLVTFGLILFFNETTRVIFGGISPNMPPPALLAGNVEIVPGLPYPAYRLAIAAVGGLVAVGLALLMAKTRIGMLIRAGAADRAMVSALGVNIKWLYSLIFGLGAMLAALAGVMAGPILAIEVGMGENILIQAFVVVILGGIGSVRGSFVAALAVGMADSLGRAFLPLLLSQFFKPTTVSALAPAMASTVIYVLMAVVLLWRPQGILVRRRA